MKLRHRTLSDLADFVSGGSGGYGGDSRIRGDTFIYRSSSVLTSFFRDCETDYTHDGTSRVPWTLEVLTEMNDAPCSNPELPSDNLILVIQRLMDRSDFEQEGKDFDAAFAQLKRTLGRDGIEPYLDNFGVCQLRAGEVTSTALRARSAGWTNKDLERRAKWEAFLSGASEDEFTEILVQLLKMCGFQRIEVAGHKDKALEFGKDLWMKFRLPTGHWIYFAIQVKKGRIDSAGKTRTGRENVTEILNQVRMALLHPVMDRSINREVLVDHVYVVASGEITKQAKSLLVRKLDEDKRRHLIFMDREEILDLVVQKDVPLPDQAKVSDDGIPF